MQRNNYAAVNAVMGTTSTWRDKTMHKGEHAVTLKYEPSYSNNAGTAHEQLEQKRLDLMALPSVLQMWVSTSTRGWPPMLCVKVDPSKL